MATNTNTKSRVPYLGLLAEKNNFITKEQLQEGLIKCSGEKDLALALKDYLLSNQLVSSQNMERLLRAARALEIRKKEFTFGAIAIQKGFINQSVLNLALEQQQTDIKNKKKIRLLGDLLVEAGMLTEKQRDDILNLQKRIRQEIKKKPDETPEACVTTGSGVEILENQVSDPAQKEIGLLDPEIIEGGIKLEISKDLMTAFLSKTEVFDKTISPDQIRDVLHDKGIVHGIAGDESIEGFINSSGVKTRGFRVAMGVPPISGKDAKVEFFFTADYLKAGGLTESGTIDFKDRGEIPFVEEGTVLAEKIPRVEARRGRNIYGDEIETISGKDLSLKIGNGAKLSEDGVKVLATVTGVPKYTLSGHIFVHQEYVTQGDVDYETGHISYHGNVIVKGRIKSGFKVKGNDVQAIEIEGGIITADGNVRIAGGINEGKIYARGNVYAKFIHNSEVICMGDVVIEKEIVDADVECSGSCVVENGKLISSRISAKKGVKALNIGTERADPCSIKVGHDVFTQKELKKNQDRVDQLKKQIEHHQKNIEKLKQESLRLQQQITEFAHVQDRSQLEEKQIHSRLMSMGKKTSEAPGISELKKKREQLIITAQNAETDLEACFDRSEKIEEIIEKQDREINRLEKKGENLQQERIHLIERAKDDPAKPVVIVEGTIMSGTVISGLHCEKRLNEKIQRSKIMELLCTSEDGRSLNIYEMQVGSI